MVAKSEEDLERMLSELQLGEFIYEEPAVGDIEYTFKHALTHDVAYNSVLMERRRLLHERTGAALESMYAGSLDDHVAELAHHFARSGNPGKAVEYCLRAVRQCTYRGSNTEAVAHFETGLELLQKLPDDDRRAELELDLRNAAGMALSLVKGYASLEVERSWERAMVLCRRPGIDWAKSWGALLGICMVQFTRPDMRKACEMAAELVARAEEHGRTEQIWLPLQMLAMARMYGGRARPGRRSLRPRDGAVGIHFEAGSRFKAAARRANAPSADTRDVRACQPHALGIKPAGPGLPGSRTGAG